ncbi:MAG: ABC transporter permease subunit [Pseudomonadota bacterium]
MSAPADTAPADTAIADTAGFAGSAAATARPAHIGLPPAALAAIGAMLGLLAVVPFALVVVISLGQNVDGAAWHWGLTLENYMRFFVGIGWPEEISTLYAQKLYYSVHYAVLGSVLAVALAFPFAYLITRRSRRAQTAWLVVLLASVSLSEVFVVMGWDILLSNRSGLPMVFRETGLTQLLKDLGVFPTLRDWGLANPRDVRFKPSEIATLLAVTYVVWPYAVILLYPPLSRVDNAMIEAARTMGATHLTVIRTVVIPAVRLPLVGATLLLFVYVLGVYVAISVFAAPARQTLALSIYDAVRGSTLNAPFGAAQAVVLLSVAGLFLALSAWIGKRAEAKA